jgi:Leucine-rich repeat (LRR) protein
MPKLSELALDFNCFTNIDDINIPSQIKRLFVRGNQLTHLNISDLPELELCILDRNPLTKLSMKRMPKLAEVGLINTQIKSQADMDLPNTVKKLFLHNNQL